MRDISKRGGMKGGIVTRNKGEKEQPWKKKNGKDGVQPLAKTLFKFEAHKKTIVGKGEKRFALKKASFAQITQGPLGSLPLPPKKRARP